MNNLHSANQEFSHIPIIDIGSLVAGTQERHTVTAQMGQACRECGFFYIIGHGVDLKLQQRLEQLSRQFFAQDLDTKLEISMERILSSWRRTDFWQTGSKRRYLLGI